MAAKPERGERGRAGKVPEQASGAGPKDAHTKITTLRPGGIASDQN